MPDHSVRTPPRVPEPPSDDEQGTLLLERRRQRTRPPRLYQVVMLNDDYTPMEFVVGVLQEFFGKNLEAATRIMLQIHQQGRGVCGVFPRDIAVTKVQQVLAAAQHAGHPLQCVAEPAG